MKKFKHKQDSPEIEMPTFQQITEDAGTKTGIQTMLRITSTNHIRLSEMADTKANILISVNAIIISVIFPIIVPIITITGILATGQKATAIFL